MKQAIIFQSNFSLQLRNMQKKNLYRALLEQWIKHYLGDEKMINVINHVIN